MASIPRVLPCLVLVTLMSCAGRGPSRETSALTIAKPPDGPCPTIPDSTVPDSSPTPQADSGHRILIRDGPTHFGYVSILIDGQWAAWNDSNAGGGRPLGPDVDANDVDRVEISKPAAAQREYGTCPGVGLIIITTKSKKWRPYLRGPS